MANIKCLFGYHDLEDIPGEFILSGKLIDQVKSVFQTIYDGLPIELQSRINFDSATYDISNIYIFEHWRPRIRNEKIYKQICLRCSKPFYDNIEKYVNNLTDKTMKTFDEELNKAKRKLKAKQLASENRNE